MIYRCSNYHLTEKHDAQLCLYIQPVRDLLVRTDSVIAI